MASISRSSHKPWRRSFAAALAVALGAAAMLTACSDAESERDHSATTGVRPTWSLPSVADDPASSTGLDANRRARADALINLFENGDAAPGYAAVATLGDGRGVTAGRAGFTSATGDLALVVSRYVALRPDSELARFVAPLERLARTGSSATKPLRGFAAAWRGAADDPAMRTVQDDVTDELYYRPAMAIATTAGLRLPLSLAAIYDTAVQHGVDVDADGLPALVAQATRATGGSPRDGIDERRWLAAFLDARRSHLLHAADRATRRAWSESVGRVDTFVDLLDRGNTALDGPFTVDVFGQPRTIA